MLTLAPAIFLALALPLMLGYLLPAISSTSPRQSFAWRLLLGLSALIVLITYTGAVTGSQTYAPYVALSITALFLLFPRPRSAFLQDLRQLLPRPSSWLAALFAFTIILLSLYPILAHHYINFGGTLNNDNYAYVANIEYIQHADYLHVPPYLRDKPALRLVYEFTSFRVVGGRLGAESYAALIGSLTRLDALHIYQPLYALGYIFWLAASYLFTKSLLKNTSLSPRFLWLPFILLQPFFLFFFANGNFANFFGVCLAVPLVVLIRQYFTPPPHSSLSADSPTRTLTKCFQVALLTNALLATYPELLLPTLGLIILILFQPALQRQWKTLTAQLRPLAFGLLLGLLLNPLNTIRGFIGIHSIAQSIKNDPNPPPDIISALHPSQLIPALIGMFTWKIYHLPHLLCWLLTLALLVTFALGLYRARDRYLPAAALLLFLLQWTAVHLSHFGYGYQKTAQYWSIYYLSLLTLGIIAAAEILIQKRRQKISAFWKGGFLLSAFASLAWLAYLVPMQLNDMYLKSSERHITPALYNLVNAIPPKLNIFLRIETFPPHAINYYANFLPLALQNHPCYYPPIGGPYAYIDGIPAYRYDDLINALHIPPYVLYGPANLNKLLLLHSHPVVTNREFTLDQPAAHAYLFSGEYGSEPNFGRWMAETLTIDALNPKPAVLNIHIAMRYQPLPPSPYITVTLDNHETQIPLLNNNDATFSIPLTPPGTHHIEIHSPTGALSPKSLGLSPDARTLSYLITRLSLDDQPDYPTITFAPASAPH